MNEDPGSAGSAGNPSEQPPTEGAFSWADALGDQKDELGPLVETKGWKNPADAIKSYAHLEKLVGADRIAIPKPGDDAGFRIAMEALGAPKEAAGYEFTKPADLPDGFYSDEFAGQFREMAHEVGLTAMQARALHDRWVAEAQKSVTETQTEAAKLAEAEAAKLDAELKTEWGKDYDQRVELARRAQKHFSDDATSDALEKAIGSAAIVKLFARIGEHFGEDTLVGQGGDEFAGPEGAIAEIGRMKLNKDFMDALGNDQHLGHADAKRKWREVHDKAFPGVVNG